MASRLKNGLALGCTPKTCWSGALKLSASRLQAARRLSSSPSASLKLALADEDGEVAVRSSWVIAGLGRDRLPWTGAMAEEAPGSGGSGRSCGGVRRDGV